MKSFHPFRWGGAATILGLCLPFIACSHPVQRSLEGRWLGEAVENFDNGQLAAATGWARGVSFEFSGSSVTVTVPAEEPRSGRYRVGSVHHTDVKLAFTDARGQTSHASFKLDSDHSMRWLLGEGRALVLRREP
jgi:hypothetical protein